LKRTFPVAEIRSVRVEGGELQFAVDAEMFALQLGADAAARWAKKIATPPPSLAKQFGVSAESKALIIGALEDAALGEALKGATAVDKADARLSLAVVADDGALRRALRGHEALPRGAPIWIVHGKGPRAAFGETRVQELMRKAGYMDSKVSAISDALSATRFARRRDD
jgi:hypothetical protein